jgi:pyruvate formate lyase activating enzyme
MVIGGLVKFSLNDYPGKTSAVIFTRGCNFRCSYCHNPELVLPEKYAPEIPLADVFSFLESRKGKLDAVTITGGEPTQHPDLADVIKEIKKMGFFAKIDTNGTQPQILKDVIEEGNIDYIAMDIKAPFHTYQKITCVQFDPEKMKRSAEMIINSGIPHEFRTTVVSSLTTFEDLRKIAESIKGAQNYFLQRFVPAKKMNNLKLKNDTSYSEEELKSLASELMTFVKYCGVR